MPLNTMKYLLKGEGYISPFRWKSNHRAGTKSNLGWKKQELKLRWVHDQRVCLCVWELCSYSCFLTFLFPVFHQHLQVLLFICGLFSSASFELFWGYLRDEEKWWCAYSLIIIHIDRLKILLQKKQLFFFLRFFFFAFIVHNAATTPRPIKHNIKNLF